MIRKIAEEMRLEVLLLEGPYIVGGERVLMGEGGQPIAAAVVIPTR